MMIERYNMSEKLSKMSRGLREPSRASHYVISRLRGKLYKAQYSRNGERFTCGRNFGVRSRLDISGPGKVRIGDSVLFEGGPFRINTLYTFSPEAEIHIGSHSFLNGIKISCRTKIEIGNWCISADARITDTVQHSVFPDRWNPATKIETSPVIIEDNVWICLAAIILKGVRIGKNSVVAAGAVVSRDVPPNCIVAGNPADVVKTFSEDEVKRAEEFFSRFRAE